jgi:hypothetical protein
VRGKVNLDRTAQLESNDRDHGQVTTTKRTAVYLGLATPFVKYMLASWQDCPLESRDSNVGKTPRTGQLENSDRFSEWALRVQRLWQGPSMETLSYSIQVKVVLRSEDRPVLGNSGRYSTMGRLSYLK